MAITKIKVPDGVSCKDCRMLNDLYWEGNYIHFSCTAFEKELEVSGKIPLVYKCRECRGIDLSNDDKKLLSEPHGTE